MKKFLKIEEELVGIMSAKDAKGWLFSPAQDTCFTCGQEMKNVKDPVTGETSEYLLQCPCMKESGIYLSKG